LSEALRAHGVHVHWAMRLGYPWDMQGQSHEKVDMINSSEGDVALQHDPDWHIGGPDSVYCRKYADYLVERLLRMETLPSVLHAHSKYLNGQAVAVAAEELGLKSVYEMRGLWHLTRAYREPSFRDSDFFRYEELMEVQAAQACDAVVVISHELKEWLVARGVPSSKIHLVPNALDSASLRLVGSKTTHKHGSDVLRLAFMGSITSYEGIDTVIRSVAALLKQGYNVSYDVFGDGPARGQLTGFAKKLGVEKAVSFHGRVDREKLLHRIGEFDVFPYIRADAEVTQLVPPLKHLEPMAAGQVVLISQIRPLMGNVPECVREHAVAAGDAIALSEKLKMLFDAHLRDELGKESQAWVVDRRSWEANSEIYEGIYLSLCS
jgi:glycosyltransferase involved in cell wall biosynthesis